MDQPMGFGITDYCIIGASLIVCVFIPFFTRPKKRKDNDFIYGNDNDDKGNTVDEYLLGNRKMSVIPVAFSITATLLSANSMTGTTGEIFINGIQFLLLMIGYIIGQMLVAKWIVPVLHNIKIVSIYEYIELRFDRSLRMIFSVVFLFINLIINGVFLFAPAISFTTITGFPYWITSSVTGVVCTMYCIMGGLKAVIWADVFQTFLIFTSTIMIAVQGIIDGGGFVQIFQKTFEGRMDEHFVLIEDFSKRYSVWAIIVWGTVSCLWGTVSSQAGAQRLISVKNTKQAQASLVISMVLIIIFNVLIILAAVAIFAKFTDCDPLQRPMQTGIYMPDQLLIYAAGKMLGHIPGLLGIAMAGLISAALSTISSFINSFAACTLEDYLKPYFPNLTRTDKRNLIICKVLTAFYGVLSIGLSLAVPHLGGIIRVLFAIIGALSGPLMGALFLAFFYRNASANACKVGIFVSLIFSMWMSIGSLIYPPITHGVKHTLNECPAVEPLYNDKILRAFANPLSPDDNSTYPPINGSFLNTETNSSKFAETTTSFPISHAVTHDIVKQLGPMHNTTDGPSVEASDANDGIFPLYKVSYMWVQPISTALSCVVSIIFSWILKSKVEPDEKLLSPLIVRNKKYQYAKIVKRQTRDDILSSEDVNKLSDSKL